MKRLAFVILALFPIWAQATVTTKTISVTFTCTGSTGPYPFTFSISDPTALTVTENGVLLASTAYTVTPVNNNYDNGGNVVLNDACVSGSLILQRVTPIVQTSVFSDNMPVPMKSFENGLDKSTEIEQELNATIAQVQAAITASACTAGNALQSINPIICVPVTGSGGGNPNPPLHSVQFAGASGFDSVASININSSTNTLTAQNFNGVRNAASYQTGGGNNGIANALAANAFIIADPTYPNIEAQPFGGANGSNVVQINGPKGSDPFAQFLDQRPGVPQFVFNGSVALDNRHTAAPAFVTNFTGNPFLTGTYNNPGPTMVFQNNYWTGAQNSTVDKTNMSTIRIQDLKYAQVQGGGSINHTVRGFGNGDLVGYGMDIVSYGGPTTAGDEGNEATRWESIEGGRTFNGTVTSSVSAGDGTTTVVVDAAFGSGGTQGEGRILIDTSAVYNAGYINAIYTTAGDLYASCAGCDWDGNYGTSTKTKLNTDVTNPVNGTNSFPQTNTVLHVDSSVGFVVGHLACIFDYDYECEKITSVGSGTVTIAIDRLPHTNGAYVTTGGMAGYAIEFEADRVNPYYVTAPNGVVGSNGVATMADEPLIHTVRYALPVMFNTAGNNTAVFQGGNQLPGGSPIYTGRAYTSINGSGGTCSVTVSGGVLASVSVSGGSGYGPAAPAAILTGTWSRQPVLEVTGIGGGAVTSAAILDPGAGIVGTPSCAIVTYNPYDVYPAAKTVQVYNLATGSVDGTTLTEPWPVTPTAGHTVEQPHYFWQHISLAGANVVGQYMPSLGVSGHDALDYYLAGIWQGNDNFMSIVGQSHPTLYQGYPSQQNLLGRNTLVTPNLYNINGSFRQMLAFTQPPFAPQIGYKPSLLYTGCGTIGCAAWTSPYYIWASEGATQINGMIFNPSSDTATSESKNLDLSLSNLNLGTPSITSNSGLVAQMGQNWNPNSNDMTSASWSCDTGVTVAQDTTKTDPWGGLLAVWRVDSSVVGKGCGATTTTSLPLLTPISGSVWLETDGSVELCANIANVNTSVNPCVTPAAGVWTKAMISGGGPFAGSATRGTYVYINNTTGHWWMFNAVAESGRLVSTSALINRTPLSITTDIAVNSITGSTICTSYNGACIQSSDTFLSASDWTWNSNPTVLDATSPTSYSTSLTSGTSMAAWKGDTNLNGGHLLPVIQSKIGWLVQAPAIISDTLGGSQTAIATSITVTTSHATWGTSGGCLQVDQEIECYAANAANGNTAFTVTRGQYGTVAQPHSNLAVYTSVGTGIAYAKCNTTTLAIQNVVFAPNWEFSTVPLPAQLCSGQAWNFTFDTLSGPAAQTYKLAGIGISPQPMVTSPTAANQVAISAALPAGGYAYSGNIALQGTDTKLLTSGTVSGTGSTLCTDTNGGATTVGCTGGAGGTVSGSGTVGKVPLWTGSTTALGDSLIDYGATHASSFTLAAASTYVQNFFATGTVQLSGVTGVGTPGVLQVDAAGNVSVVPSTGVFSINGTGGAYTFSFSAGAGSCSGTTCTFTGSSSGAGTVTNFIANSANWPTWLVPTVTNGSTTPTLAVAASAIPNSALANVATTVNGATCTLGSTCTATADANTLTNTTLKSTVVTSSLTSVGTIGTGVWHGTPIGSLYGGTGIDTSASTGVPQIAAGTWSVALLPLTQLATQAADTVLTNATSGAAKPTAFAMPTCTGTDRASQYDTTGHAWLCILFPGGLSGQTIGYLPKATSATGSTINSSIDDSVTTAATVTIHNSLAVVSGAAYNTTKTGLNVFSVLPACAGGTEGMEAPVTDSVSAVLGASITGGGTNHVKAYCNGSNWIISAAATATQAVPSGMLAFIATGTCPSGWTENDSLDGFQVRVTTLAHGDVGTSGGSNSYTPAGINSTVSFTPAGTNGTAAFTPAGTNAASSAGTPAGTNGTAAVTTVGTKFTTSGSGTFAFTTLAGTASAASPTVTVPAEVFTGTAMATHNHAFTGTLGTVPAETFTGSAGTVPAETFTGTPATITPPYYKVIACQKN